MNIYQHKEWMRPNSLVMPEINITHPQDKKLLEQHRRILLSASVRFHNVSEDTEILGVVIQFRLKE